MTGADGPRLEGREGCSWLRGEKRRSSMMMRVERARAGVLEALVAGVAARGEEACVAAPGRVCW